MSLPTMPHPSCRSPAAVRQSLNHVCDQSKPGPGTVQHQQERSSRGEIKAFNWHKEAMHHAVEGPDAPLQARHSEPVTRDSCETLAFWPGGDWNRPEPRPCDPPHERTCVQQAPAAQPAPLTSQQNWPQQQQQKQQQQQRRHPCQSVQYEPQPQLRHSRERDAWVPCSGGWRWEPQDVFEVPGHEAAGMPPCSGQPQPVDGMGWPGFHRLSSDELLFEVLLGSRAPQPSCPAFAAPPCAPQSAMAAPAPAVRHKRVWGAAVSNLPPLPQPPRQLPAQAVAVAAAAAVHAQPATHEAVPLEVMVEVLRSTGSTAVEDEGDSEDAWVWAGVGAIGPATGYEAVPGPGGCSSEGAASKQPSRQLLSQQPAKRLRTHAPASMQLAVSQQSQLSQQLRHLELPASLLMPQQQSWWLTDGRAPILGAELMSLQHRPLSYAYSANDPAAWRAVPVAAGAGAVADVPILVEGMGESRGQVPA